MGAGSTPAPGTLAATAEPGSAANEVPTETSASTPKPGSKQAGPSAIVPKVTSAPTAAAIAGTAARLPGEPDPKLTPGATNPAVTQADIGSTICVSGWTATVRPPESYTEALKRTGIVAYGYTDTNLADYEEDHLISLEIGGSPTAPANLCPEPYTVSLPDGTPVGARVKDQVENKLHELVCSRSMTLATAQRLIATDWIAAWRTYVVGGSIAPPGPAATAKPASTPRPTTPPSTGAITVAITSLTSPVSPGSTASVTAQTAGGAACTIVVEYKSGPSRASGLGSKTASASGTVSWSWTVGTQTTPGSWPVTVTCTSGGASASETESVVVQ